MEQSQVIRALSSGILDLSSRLEVVERGGDVRPEIQMESREAYMQRLKVEDPDRWIELLAKEEGDPSASTSSPSS